MIIIMIIILIIALAFMGTVAAGCILHLVNMIEDRDNTTLPYHKEIDNE